MMNYNKLKKILEQTHKYYISSHEKENDAQFSALNYKKRADREFAAFICAVLAYGKINHIKSSTEKVLKPMGVSPTKWLDKSTVSDIKKLTRNWKHRFNTSYDMLVLLVLLKQVYIEHGSMEKWLSPKASDSAYDLLEKLVDKIQTTSLPKNIRKPTEGDSFWFLFPRPSKGSACKRLNLYLRWMVGNTETDFNLWKSFSRRNLIVPMDTHMMKQALSLELTKRKQADWKTALEVTESLKNLDPDDPTRFDFALCHLSINGKVLKLSDFK